MQTNNVFLQVHVGTCCYPQGHDVISNTCRYICKYLILNPALECLNHIVFDVLICINIYLEGYILIMYQRLIIFVIVQCIRVIFNDILCTNENL